MFHVEFKNTLVFFCGHIWQQNVWCYATWMKNVLFISCVSQSSVIELAVVLFFNIFGKVVTF